MSNITLLDYQQRGLERVAGHNHCALYWTMGLGKTFAGSELMVQYHTRCNLIVCQKTKLKDWFEHCSTFYGSEYQVLNLTKKKEYVEFIEQCSNTLITPKQIIGVINYDVLYRRAELMKLSGFTVIYDESSMLKNDTSKRTKAALKLKSAHNILLSGTPVGGKYEELWSQAQLLGWRIKKKEFLDRFVLFTDFFPAGSSFPIKLVSGYKNVDELKRYLIYFGADFLKAEDVLTLPEQTFINIYCDVTAEYNTFADDSIVYVQGETIVGSTPLSKLVGLRQLASGYNPHKAEKLCTLLESTSERLVLFYNFWEEFNVIQECCKGRPVSVVNGKYFDLTAYERYNDSVTIVQYQAGAMGLNLQKANTIIYFSPTLSSELFEQSKKRIHRIGQKNTCFYYQMQSGIEEHIYQILAKRRDYTLQLFVPPQHTDQ